MLPGRRAIEISFTPELAAAEPEVLDLLDATLSWDTWNRLRTAQGCSATKARRLLTFAVETLLEGSKQ